MNLNLLKTILCLLSCSQLHAAPGTITPYIKIDQFGYLPNSKKVAVIVDPQTGYNAAESFSPGTGLNNYQVRRWADDVVVYSGTLSIWNSGATHTQSGDKGWWFDFSSLTTSGSYYIFDVAQNKGSYRFEIGTNAYSEVLKHAVRVFYYQRINFAKAVPYADARWADGAAFGGANQDHAARSRYDKTNPATAKDLHGGWMDAGDYNKYTSFTFAPLCTMLEVFRLYPSIFADNYGIPESGNGIPDLMDEIKWELDWLKRMQDASGTGGLYLKVGVDNYNAASPPSADANPRYYLGECTSATLTGAAVFALASIAYRQIGTPAMITYADDLLARAQSAWTRALTTTSNFTSFQTSCDDQDIKAGDADMSIAEQKDRAITAAAYLYEATGLATYKTVFENMYTQAQPYSVWWWGPYYTAVQRALLRYAGLPGVTATVSNNIRSMKSGQDGVVSINHYNSSTDLYRAYLPDDQYHWGNSQVKADAGVHNWDYVSFNINTPNQSLYKEVAEQYLHWFHGVNPMGKVLLSNMYAYGGDDCANEIYHSWFANGTVWDNAISSTKGPAPAYVQGGPNKNYAIAAVTPPYNQPPQKAYKDWNTVWNGTFSEDSWEITEPAIYYQASYISLLARVMGNQPPVSLPVHFLGISGNRSQTALQIFWKIEADEAIESLVVERSINGKDYLKIIELQDNGTGAYSFDDKDPVALLNSCSYRVRVNKLNGGSIYSSVLFLPVKAGKEFISIAPNPVIGNLNLQTNGSAGKQLQMRIYDVHGKMLKEEWFTISSGITVKSMDISFLVPGMYILKITGDKVGELKFIKN